MDAPGGGEEEVEDQITSSSPPLAATGPLIGDAVAQDLLVQGQGLGADQEIQDEVGQDDEDEYVPRDVVTLDLTAGGTGEASTAGKIPIHLNDRTLNPQGHCTDF